MVGTQKHKGLALSGWGVVCGQGGFWREAAPLGQEQEEGVSSCSWGPDERWGPEKGDWGGICCDPEDSGEWLLNISKLSV